jgi:hypothetical protein
VGSSPIVSTEFIRQFTVQWYVLIVHFGSGGNGTVTLGFLVNYKSQRGT